MIRTYPKSILATILALLLAAFSDATAGPPWQLAPFWHGTTVASECVLFIKTGTALPLAVLTFTPTSITRIVRQSTGATYVEGVDYTVNASTKTITLTAGSAIPYFTHAYMYPSSGVD